MNTYEIFVVINLVIVILTVAGIILRGRSAFTVKPASLRVLYYTVTLLLALTGPTATAALVMVTLHTISVPHMGTLVNTYA